MNRRSFMRAVVTSPLVGALAVAVGVPRKYGRMDVDAARAKGYFPAKVFLDGQDVSMDCYICDDIEGWVHVWTRNDDGHIHMNEAKTEVVNERRYGHVRFVPKR